MPTASAKAATSAESSSWFPKRLQTPGQSQTTARAGDPRESIRSRDPDHDGGAETRPCGRSGVVMAQRLDVNPVAPVIRRLWTSGVPESAALGHGEWPFPDTCVADAV